MRGGRFALFAGWLAAGLVVVGASPQAVPAPGAIAAELTGSWKLDRDKTKDGQDVWKRRLDAMRAAQEAEASSGSVFVSHPTPPSIYNGDWQLRSAMRDLLEVAERLSFRVAGESVTITDDLKRALTFATTGNKEKRQLAATEFNARTRWSGGALTQELTVDELVITEVYLPSEDGREMLVSIAVDKPEFSPPLKNIMRVYTRVDAADTSGG